MNDYARRRLEELHAAAPVKSKKVEPYAAVSLSLTAKAFAPMNCPKAMIWVWLVHQTRRTGKRTVAVPNGVLAKYGTSREIKRRALRELEAVGLITVERPANKNPVVTLLK